MDGFSPLNVLRKARSNHEWKRWRQNYSVFLVELRALALAVLAVQVCAAEGLACKFCSFLVSIASLQTLAKPER